MSNGEHMKFDNKFYCAFPIPFFYKHASNVSVAPIAHYSLLIVHCFCSLFIVHCSCHTQNRHLQIKFPQFNKMLLWECPLTEKLLSNNGQLIWFKGRALLLGTLMIRRRSILRINVGENILVRLCQVSFTLRLLKSL
jgi:hypothetical protein